MLAAVIFDFDGVIANSEPLHFRAFRDVTRIADHIGDPPVRDRVVVELC